MSGILTHGGVSFIESPNISTLHFEPIPGSTSDDERILLVKLIGSDLSDVEVCWLLLANSFRCRILTKTV